MTARTHHCSMPGSVTEYNNFKTNLGERPVAKLRDSDEIVPHQGEKFYGTIDLTCTKNI